MKKTIIISAVTAIITTIALMFICGEAKAKYDLDPRYEAAAETVTMARDYMYLGKIKLPLQTIYDLQWWSDSRSYKKTLIVETYSSNGKVIKTIKCTKLLNWWQPEKANCQTK